MRKLRGSGTAHPTLNLCLCVVLIEIQEAEPECGEV